MKKLEDDFINKILTKKDVVSYIIKNSEESELVNYLIERISKNSSLLH